MLGDMQVFQKCVVSPTAACNIRMNSPHGVWSFITPEDPSSRQDSIPSWQPLWGLCCKPGHCKWGRGEEKTVMTSVIFERGLTKHFYTYLDKLSRLLVPVKGKQCPAATACGQGSPPTPALPRLNWPLLQPSLNPAFLCLSETRELQ